MGYIICRIQILCHYEGKYDYDGGLWGHDYIVTDLTATSMTWTAKDDETFVQKFERPAEK